MVPAYIFYDGAWAEEKLVKNMHVLFLQILLAGQFQLLLHHRHQVRSRMHTCKSYKCYQVKTTSVTSFTFYQEHAVLCNYAFFSAE